MYPVLVVDVSEWERECRVCVWVSACAHVCSRACSRFKRVYWQIYVFGQFWWVCFYRNLTFFTAVCIILLVYFGTKALHVFVHDFMSPPLSLTLSYTQIKKIQNDLWFGSLLRTAIEEAQGEEILQYYKHVWFLNLLDLKYLHSVQSVHHCLVEIGKWSTYPYYSILFTSLFFLTSVCERD